MLKKKQLAEIEATTAAVKEIAIPMPEVKKTKAEDKPINNVQLSLAAKFFNLFISKKAKISTDIKYIPSNPLIQHDFLDAITPYLGLNDLLKLMQTNKDLLKLIMVTNSKRNKIIFSNPFFPHDLAPTSRQLSLPFVEARQIKIRHGQIITAINELIEKIDVVISNVEDLNEYYNTCCGLECCYCNICETDLDDSDAKVIIAIISAILAFGGWLGTLIWLSISAADKGDDYKDLAILEAILGLIIGVPAAIIILFHIIRLSQLCLSPLIEVVDNLQNCLISKDKINMVSKKNWQSVSHSLQELIDAMSQYQNYFHPEIAKSFHSISSHVTRFKQPSLWVQTLKENLKALKKDLLVSKSHMLPSRSPNRLFSATQSGPHTIVNMHKGTDFKSDVAEKMARKLK